jgi:hypothetical protein
MKRIGISMLASLLLVSGVFAQRSIVVTNSTGMDRKAEMVEAKACCKKSCIISKSVVLKNDKGVEVPYQLVYNAKKEIQGLIFQADVKANSSATYFLSEGKPAAVKAKTFGRFVPERKDDFAWETDFAAYRMYGPALAKENPSNGVDFWAKCTDELVIDQRYKDDIYNGISYHADHGKGLDFYKVAHTLGCGGMAPYTADSLWIGNQFSSYKVLENGPLRTMFTLTYDSVKVGNDFYKETITITANAGSLLNKAVVTFTGKAGKAGKMDLASGIFLHDGKGNLELKKENGMVAYAEEAVSDFGVPAGRNYVGVYVPGKDKDGMQKGEHAFILSGYKVGSTFTYYFGGGWSKWKFPTDADWFKAVNDFTTKTNNPLKVKMK